MKTYLLRHRRVAAETIHAALIALALAGSFLLRFEFDVTAEYRLLFWEALPLVLVSKAVVFRVFSLRDLAWRYIDVEDLTRLAAANLIASGIAAGGLRWMIGEAFPRSIYVLDLLACLALMTIMRGVVRKWFEQRRGGGSMRRRILIYGAGKAGRTVLSEIRAHSSLGYQVVGFIDDDAHKRHLRFHGMRVLGSGANLRELVRRQRIDEVLLALPLASGPQIAAIVERCQEARVATRKIPPLAELIESKVLVEQIREVRLEDLLGRPPVHLEESGIRAGLAGGVILVTGAGGSIGSELCRQIARYGPATLIGLDQAETALYQIDQELREKFPAVSFIPEMGSIQNRQRLAEIFDRHRPDAVYHAAAYKHVPMMEAHLFEAVENNIFGTREVVEAARAAGVATFVLVSSDKAVRPASVMGATKRIAELICTSAGVHGQTRFLAVRFGNVLGSNGSVIPLFQRQIAAGGPVTVTHPDMRRYFMTIPEAAQLVLQAAAMKSGGEIFVLEMGEPVRIVDLARKLVLLSGLKPDEDIEIRFTGVRPGEKFTEELNAYEEDTLPTTHRQIRIFMGRGASREDLSSRLLSLQKQVARRDASAVLLCLKELIPEYNPSTFLLRQALARDPGALAGDVTPRGVTSRHSVAAAV